MTQKLNGHQFRNSNQSIFRYVWSAKISKFIKDREEYEKH
jgi:hypothetical protein